MSMGDAVLGPVKRHDLELTLLVFASLRHSRHRIQGTREVPAREAPAFCSFDGPIERLRSPTSYMRTTTSGIEGDPFLHWYEATQPSLQAVERMNGPAAKGDRADLARS